MTKRKNNGVQGLIGFERFSKYGVKTDKAEIAFFSVEPTNISVLSAANIDEIQVEMSSARQFMFAVRFRREKDEQIFSTLNRVDKAISEHGFTARRMSKSDIKRMLALYFGTSISGEEIPDIEGENEFNLEGLHEN